MSENIDEKIVDDSLDIEFIEHVEYDDDLSKLNTICANNPEMQKIKKQKFKKSIIIYSVVLALVTVLIWVVYYNKLKNYDVATPGNTIEAVVDKYVKDGFKDLYDDVKLSNEFEEEWMLSDYLKEITTTYEVQYKLATSQDNEAVYELSANGNKFAKMHLTNMATEDSDTDEWKLTLFEVSEYLPVTNSYTITAPYNSVVYVNGIKLNSTYFKTQKVPVEILKNVETEMKAMVYNTVYEVKGFYNLPTIEVQDAKGNKLEVVEGSREFTAKYSESKETTDEFKQYVTDIMHAYARYYVKIADNINYYIRTKTNAYDMIKNATRYEYSDGMIESAKFNTYEVSEFIRYADDCYTCRVKYEYAVKVVNKNDKEIFAKDMIWTFVQYHGLWYLTDINEYH